MQSKYAWLISLADDIEDLETAWSCFLKDDEISSIEKGEIVLLFCERYEELKGR